MNGVSTLTLLVDLVIRLNIIFRSSLEPQILDQRSFIKCIGKCVDKNKIRPLIPDEICIGEFKVDSPASGISQFSIYFENHLRIGISAFSCMVISLITPHRNRFCEPI